MIANEKIEKYSWILLGIVTLTIVPLILYIATLEFEIKQDKDRGIVLIFLLILLILFIVYWTINSLKKIDADYIGCILEFGKPVAQVDSGLCFVPYWFCELRKETRLAIEEQFPEDDINKSPIRITHGTTTKPTGDPLDTRLTTSVSLKCRYKIVNYIQFIQNIGNRWELKRQIRDALVNTTAIECAKLPLSENLSRREQLNYSLKLSLEKLIKDWGIEIINVQLLEIDLGNEIDKALTNVSVSAININTNKNNAQKILFDGAAEAKVTEAFQYAKAAGLKHIAQELGLDDKAALYQIDTLANIWRKSNADLNLYGNDWQQLFGMLMSTYKANLGNNKSENSIQNNA